LEVIETAPSVDERQDAIYLPSPVRGYVEMKDVLSRTVRGSSFFRILIQTGGSEKVALVGVSGSGKSTVARLIARPV